MKTARVALIALCMLLLVLPTLAMPFFPSGETDAQGQYLADYPELTDGDGALNREFDADFEAWLCDRFAFRTWALRANALLNYRLLHTSVSDDVVAGKGDWLYYADTVPDYTGEGRLSDAELDAISANLAALSDALARRGAALYVAIVPNKSTVYPQYMPDRYAMRADGGNIERLRTACEGLPVAWIDLLSPLRRAAEGDAPVYYRTDTHWNALGAAIAARTVLEGMGRSAVGSAPAGEADFSEGDLARLMGAAGALRERVPAVAPEAPLPEADYAERRIQVPGPGEDRLLVYRDSFGTAIGPWLAQAFAATELRWESPLDATRPCDAALVLICERNLRRYLAESPDLGDAAEEDIAEDGFTDIDEDDDFFSDDALDEDGFIDIDEGDDFFTDDAPDEGGFIDIDEDDDFFSDDAPDEDDFTDIDENDDFFTDDDTEGRADDGI